MELLIIVTSAKSGTVLMPLAQACRRANINWGVFFTNDGVQALADTGISEAMQSMDRAVACQESWQRFVPESECPVELGSQTNNSVMVAEAARIVSL